MVIQLFKRIFLVNETPRVTPPNFSRLLPSGLDNQYFDYYSSGAGLNVFLIFLFLIVGATLLAKKQTTRWVLRCTVVASLLVWPSANSKIFLNTQVPFSVLSLPIPKISQSVFLFLFFTVVSIGYLIIRQHVQKMVQLNIVRFLDTGIVVLLLIFFLPIWSGELLQYD